MSSLTQRPHPELKLTADERPKITKEFGTGEINAVNLELMSTLPFSRGDVRRAVGTHF
jgi:hypothetical protein